MAGSVFDPWLEKARAAVDGALPYLKERKIPREIADLYRLGYFEKAPELDSKHPEKARWNQTFRWMKKAIVLPCYGASGRLTGVVMRSIEEKRYAVFHTDWGSVEGVIFGMAQAVQGIDATREVVAVEGGFDTLSVATAQYRQLGRINTAGLLTARILPAQLTQFCRYADVLSLAFDGDGPGKAAARTAQKNYKDNFKTIQTWECPTKDWSKWHSRDERSFFTFVENMSIF